MTIETTMDRYTEYSLKDRSNDWVAYEFMNEPVAEEHEQWNQLIAKVHKALRELEPQRTLVIGSNLWQGHQTIKYLKVPEGDKNIILSFHYYNPMLLTHYGAWWSPLCAAYKGKIHYPGVLVSKEDYDAAPDAIKPELKQYTEEVWGRGGCSSCPHVPTDIASKVSSPITVFTSQIFDGSTYIFRPFRNLYLQAA